MGENFLKEVSPQTPFQEFFSRLDQTFDLIHPK